MQSGLHGRTDRKQRAHGPETTAKLLPNYQQMRIFAGTNKGGSGSRRRQMAGCSHGFPSRPYPFAANAPCLCRRAYVRLRTFKFMSPRRYVQGFFRFGPDDGAAHSLCRVHQLVCGHHAGAAGDGCDRTGNRLGALGAVDLHGRPGDRVLELVPDADQHRLVDAGGGASVRHQHDRRGDFRPWSAPSWSAAY
jgi:hypothetical protein